MTAVQVYVEHERILVGVIPDSDCAPKSFDKCESLTLMRLRLNAEAICVALFEGVLGFF